MISQDEEVSQPSQVIRKHDYPEERRVQIYLTKREHARLQFMIGYAIGAAMKNKDRQLAEEFNSLHQRIGGA